MDADGGSFRPRFRESQCSFDGDVRSLSSPIRQSPSCPNSRLEAPSEVGSLGTVNSTGGTRMSSSFKTVTHRQLEGNPSPIQTSSPVGNEAYCRDPLRGSCRFPRPTKRCGRRRARWLARSNRRNAPYPVSFPVNPVLGEVAMGPRLHLRHLPHSQSRRFCQPSISCSPSYPHLRSKQSTSVPPSERRIVNFHTAKSDVTKKTRLQKMASSAQRNCYQSYPPDDSHSCQF